MSTGGELHFTAGGQQGFSPAAKDALCDRVQPRIRAPWCLNTGIVLRPHANGLQHLVPRPAAQLARRAPAQSGSNQGLMPAAEVPFGRRPQARVRIHPAAGSTGGEYRSRSSRITRSCDHSCRSDSSPAACNAAPTAMVSTGRRDQRAALPPDAFHGDAPRMPLTDFVDHSLPGPGRAHLTARCC